MKVSNVNKLGFDGLCDKITPNGSGVAAVRKEGF